MLSKQGLKSKRLTKKGGIDSGDAKKGEDEVIIVSSDAEDEILISALQEYVPELALLRVTRENLINAQKKNSEEIKPLIRTGSQSSAGYQSGLFAREGIIGQKS
ncbi:hypothetical protein TNCV_136951 [Trichonephila clavipes]|nr:hypothetical protein TNCV_136951 [Trichonephila clavipes]